MAKIQVLNSSAHNQLLVDTSFNENLGHDIGAVMIFPSEIKRLQKRFPLLFRKHPQTGRLFPNALLSFSENENLFIDEQREWCTDEIPMVIQKGPFMITFQQNGDETKPILSIDLDDPRVNNVKGEALFDNDQPTEYLQKANHVLSAIHHDSEHIDLMIDTFLKYDLIEPLTLDIEFESGEKINFSGAYTISEEKLSMLDGEALKALNTNHYLANAYFIANSLSNISGLIKLKNAQNI